MLKLFTRLHGRMARPAGLSWNLAKTLSYALTLWIIFYFLVPALIYRVEEQTALRRYRFDSRSWRMVGQILFTLAGALGLVSANFIAKYGRGTPLPADGTRRLVFAGPYRYVRNPMAAGGFAQAFAVGLFLGSPSVLVYALVGALGWNYFIRPWEEADLEWRFGQPYVDYRDHVRCWVPRLRPYQPPGAGREPWSTRRPAKIQ